MTGFESIVGHEEIIRHMKNSIEMRKVSHSYIFAGEPGAGKKLLARTFAMTLQCEQGPLIMEATAFHQGPNYNY